MSDLDDKLARWRSGTESLAPAPEFMDRVHQQVAAQAVQPRAFSALPHVVSSSGWGSTVGWLLGLLLTVAVGLLARHVLSTASPTEQVKRPPPAAVQAEVMKAQKVGPEFPLAVSPSYPAARLLPQTPAPRRAEPRVFASPSSGVPVRAIVPAAPASSSPTAASLPAREKQPPEQTLASVSFADPPVVYARQPGESTRPPAYPFDAVTIDGQHVSLKELRGKVVLIEFWENGCGLCRESVKPLLKMKRDYPQVSFISFAVDPEEELRRRAVDDPYPLPMVADPDAVVAGNYGVDGFPTFAVVDRFGRRVPVVRDFYERYSKVREALDAALKEPPPEPASAPLWFEGECDIDGLVATPPGIDLRGGIARLLDATGQRRMVLIGLDGRFAIHHVPCIRYQLWANGHDGYGRDLEATKVEVTASAGAVTHVELHAEPTSPLPPTGPRRPLTHKP